METIEKSREETHFLTVCVLAPSLSHPCSHHGHNKICLWSKSICSWILVVKCEWRVILCFSMWPTLQMKLLNMPFPSDCTGGSDWSSIFHCLHKLEFCSLAGRVLHFLCCFVLFWSLGCWPFLLSSRFPNKFYKFLLLKLHWPETWLLGQLSSLWCQFFF